MTSKRKRLNLTTAERFVTAASFYSLKVFCFVIWSSLSGSCPSIKHTKGKDGWSDWKSEK